MEKNLKDYLHLYMGCEICWFDGPHSGTLTGLVGYLTESNYRVEIRTKTKGKNSYECFMPLTEQCKLVLRPLSSMTEDEFKWIAKVPDAAILYNKRHTANAIIWDYKFRHPNPALNNEDGFSYSGTSFSHRDKLSANDFKYLLSKHFDLFGLIDSGLAIDATTITPKNA